MHRQDTLQGIVEFCEGEGQPCDSLRAFIAELGRQADAVLRSVAFAPGDAVTVVTGAELVSASEYGAAFKVTEAHTLPRQAFEGLLAFATRNGGHVVISAPWAGEHRRRDSWRVEVHWQSQRTGQDQSVFAEDNTMDEACVMCRGLVAHSIASGVAT